MASSVCRAVFSQLAKLKDVSYHIAIRVLLVPQFIVMQGFSEKVLSGLVNKPDKICLFFILR